MIVLDSDILIEILRGEPVTTRVVQALHAQGETLATTSLNVAESLRGEAHSPSGLATAQRKLRGLQEIPFGPRAARRFAQIMHTLDRAGAPVPGIDGMIAAAAVTAGARLVTRNVRHFERVPGLEIIKV